MTVYLITYDLSSSEKDYSSLFTAIENLGDARRILKSVWLVATDKNANQIVNLLREVIDEKSDLLYVVKNDTDRQGWMYKNHWEWLDKYK